MWFFNCCSLEHIYINLWLWKGWLHNYSRLMIRHEAIYYSTRNSNLCTTFPTYSYILFIWLKFMQRNMMVKWLSYWLKARYHMNLLWWSNPIIFPSSKCYRNCDHLALDEIKSFMTNDKPTRTYFKQNVIIAFGCTNLLKGLLPNPY